MARPRAPFVLVVDDEPAIRLLCRVNLEAEGLAVAEAGTGGAALELAAREVPAAVLLDLLLPDLDGWAVASALLADPRTAGVPLVLLSGLAPSAAEPAELSGLDLLAKPFDPVALARLVRELVERGAVAPPGERAARLAELRALR